MLPVQFQANGNPAATLPTQTFSPIRIVVSQTDGETTCAAFLRVTGQARECVARRSHLGPVHVDFCILVNSVSEDLVASLRAFAGNANRIFTHARLHLTLASGNVTSTKARLN